MSVAVESPSHAAVEDRPPSPTRDDTEFAMAASEIDGFTVQELRAPPPELLQLLSATGC